MSKLELLPPAPTDLHLDTDTRKKLEKLENKLETDYSQFGKLALRIARDLWEIHELLQPKRMFTIWLRGKPMSVSTSYRLIGAYIRIQAGMPPVIVERAIASNVPLFGLGEDAPYGKYTDTVKLLPPPKNPTPEQADEYLEAVKAKHAEQQKPRTKGAVLDTLAGMLCRYYLKDKRAGKFEEWIGRLEALAKQKLKEQD
jgi:hypothetical protein